MKRIVIACDGTWQDLDQVHPTNVRLLAQAVAPKDGDIEQIVYYSPGVGTRNLFDRLTGGAFGHGVNVEIASAYAFLCANYNPGDEIYLFGFSRGAFTVRSLAGLISQCGILRRENLSWLPNAFLIYRENDPSLARTASMLQTSLGHGPTSADPFSPHAVRIKFLGVWDTVGSLGIPNISRTLNLEKTTLKRHQFHDTRISPIVDYARHAVAIDEQREVFTHTEINPSDPKMAPERKPGQAPQIRQVWFPGDHGCVGGGGSKEEVVDESLPLHADQRRSMKRRFSDAALQWMIDEIKSTGEDLLKIDMEKLGLAPDHTAPLMVAKPGGFMHLRFIRDLFDPLVVVDNAIRLTGKDPRRKNPKKFCPFEDIHESARNRWRDVVKYRPKNLTTAHKDSLDGWS